MVGIYLAAYSLRFSMRPGPGFIARAIRPQFNRRAPYRIWIGLDSNHHHSVIVRVDNCVQVVDDDTVNAGTLQTVPYASQDIALPAERIPFLLPDQYIVIACWSRPPGSWL